MIVLSSIFHAAVVITVLHFVALGLEGRLLRLLDRGRSSRDCSEDYCCSREDGGRSG